MEILAYIAGLVYIIYEAASNWKNGSYPESLSVTYYLWPKWVFPSVMMFVAFTLLPVWLEATAGSNWQFLTFLSCIGIASIGLVPDYRNNQRQYKWHMLIAYITCGLASVSLIFIVGGWYWIPIWLLLNYLSDIKNFNKNYTYHIEDALIMSLLMNII